jgi:TP901 family phage tail tape measure protein
MNDVGFRLYATDDVSGPAGKARSSLLSLGGSASTVSGGLGKIGSGALTAAKNLALLGVPVALALGGIAISSTNAARTFQSSMTLIQTQAGGTADEVATMSAAVLKLAPEVGTGPEELAAGLYHVESAGLRGAKALEILKVAAEGAKVGNANLEDVTNALIAANQSGVKGVEDMAGAMGTLNAIVGAGNMRMQDLTDAMGTGVLSTAKSYGVSLQSVGAALADMTDQGIPAVDAATRINSAMRLMAAPTGTAITELKRIGLTQFALADDLRGPGGIDAAIKDLKTHLDSNGLSLDQQAALLAKAFGGKQSTGILTLIGNVGLLDAKVQAVNDGAAGFGDAWAATGQTVAEQQAQLSASFSSLKIQLGTELLPVEQRVLKGLVDLVSSDAVQSGIVDLGKGINNLFSEDNISSAEKFVSGVIPQIEDFAKNALPPFIAGLKVAGQITKEAFDIFNSLPEPLKAAIIGGLAVNKLSGGLLSSGLADVIKGAASVGTSAVTGGGGILGVQKVFVTNMGMGMGGVSTAEGGAVSGSSKLMGAVSILGSVAIAGASIYALAQAWGQFQQDTNKAQTDTAGQIDAWAAQKTTMQNNTDALNAEVDNYRSQSDNMFGLGKVITDVWANSETQKAMVTAADKLANGTSITPEGLAAIKAALDEATNNKALNGAVGQLDADYKKAQGLTPTTQGAAAIAEANAAAAKRMADILAAAKWGSTRPAADDAAAGGKSITSEALQAIKTDLETAQKDPALSAAVAQLDSDYRRAAQLPVINISVTTNVSANDVQTANVQRMWLERGIPQ